MRIVDGYLGLDVLDQRRVIFDFRAGTLTVSEAQGFFSSLWAHGNEAVVRTLGTSGRLRASNCRVNGVRAAAFVDTGAEVSVSNPALYVALQRHAANRQVLHGEVGLYGVTGRKVIGLDTNVDEIRLDRLELTYTSSSSPVSKCSIYGASATSRRCSSAWIACGASRASPSTADVGSCASMWRGHRSHSHSKPGCHRPSPAEAPHPTCS